MGTVNGFSCLTGLKSKPGIFQESLTGPQNDIYLHKQPKCYRKSSIPIKIQKVNPSCFITYFKYLIEQIKTMGFP